MGRDWLLVAAFFIGPSSVRRVTIPKLDGGECELGIPVTDRLIQQTLLQSL